MDLQAERLEQGADEVCGYLVDVDAAERQRLDEVGAGRGADAFACRGELALEVDTVGAEFGTALVDVAEPVGSGS